MRVMFMGSSTFGLPALQLLCQKHQVLCVYTRPAKPAGRGMQEQKTPIHEFALDLGIPVQTPTTLRTEAAASELSTYKPDVVIVAAYGLILPQAILDVPKHGCINIHGSLLPRWRGAAPIHHALLNGDSEIGVTIMKMDAGLDTGPILKKGVLLVEDDATFDVIHDAMAKLGGDLLIDVLDHLDTITPEIQDESLATYAHKVTKEDARINNAMSVQKVLNIIRTFGGDWGGRFTYKEEILAIHSAIVVNCVIPEDRAAVCPGPQETSHAKKEHSICSMHLFSAPKKPEVPDKPSAFRDDTILLMKDDAGRLLFPCADGVIEIQSIQRSGKRIMTTKEFLNGFKLRSSNNSW